MRRTTPFIHTSTQIVGFFGEASCLSNFHPSPIQLWNHKFLDGEAAFQAAKLEKEEDRSRFVGLSQGSAKSEGRRVKLRSDWEAVKTAAMLEVVTAKFSQNPNLLNYLLSTGQACLEERNYWNDRVWGTNLHGEGQNRLGKILMEVRNLLKTSA